MGIVLSTIFALLCLPLNAITSHRPCTIDDDRAYNLSLNGKHYQYSAECYYEFSGPLTYWIFSVHFRPACETLPELFGPCEPRPSTGPESLTPHTTAITGFPAMWKIQREYQGAFPASILQNWSKRQEQIEQDWRNREYERRNDQPISKLLPNRTSPFLPVFTRPKLEAYGYAFALPKHYSVKELEAACGSSGCDQRSFGEIVAKQFQSWVLPESHLESLVFPPSRVHYLPGAINLETLRVPLYNASVELVTYWSQFWADCWETTPAGKTCDGCQAELREYIVGSALQKASSKMYPTQRLAGEARLIAQAIDAARRFHETTRDLLPLMQPEKWSTAGAESTHLELDDIPQETKTKIRIAQHELTDAIAAAGAALKNQTLQEP
jgi:hypothetical protein